MRTRPLSRSGALALPCLLAALPLVTPAAAQTGPGLNYDFAKDHLDHYLVTRAAADYFQRTVTGSLTSNHLPDYVALVGEEAVFGIGVGMLEAGGPIDSTAVRDVEMLKGWCTDGRDAIALALAGGGVEVWAVDESIPELVHVRTYTDPKLVGLQAIRVAQVNGTGTADLVGISANRQELVILSNPHQGAITNTVSTVSLGLTLHDLEAVNWVDDVSTGIEPLEIAVTTSSGMKVIRDDGAVLKSYGSDNMDVERMCALSDPALGGDLQYLALFTKMGTAWWLFVMGDGVGKTPLFLANAGVAGVAAGYHDGDLRTDMVLSITADSRAVIMVSQGLNAAQPFDLATDNYGYIELGAGSGTNLQNRARPAFADLDGDGDSDLLVGVEKEDTFAMCRNQTVNHREYSPPITAPNWGPGSGSPGGSGGPASIPDTNVFCYDSSVPLEEGGLVKVELTDPLQRDSGQLHIQWVVWRSDGGPPKYYNAQNPEDYGFYDLVNDGGWPAKLEFAAVETTVEYDGDDPNDGSTEEELFTLYVRMVELDPVTDEIVSANTPAIYIFSAHPQGAVSLANAVNPNFDPSTDQYDIPVLTDDCSDYYPPPIQGASDYVAAIVQLDCTICWELGIIPEFK